VRIDISREFQTAFDQKNKWSRGLAKGFISDIYTKLNNEPLNNESIVLDWEEQTGEGWAAFSSNNTIAFACIVVPLIFVKSAYVLQVEQICKNYEAIIIDTEDFDDKRFIVDSDVLENIFGFEMSAVITEAEAVSVNDIWFSTV